KVKLIPVDVAQVKKQDFVKGVVLSGTTKPQATATLLPKIMAAEKVINLSVEVGDRVSAGETIAVLDQSTVSIQLNSARTTYEDLQRNYERNKVLFEAGALPQASLEQLELQLIQAKNSLEAQEIAFNNTIIKSPISGVVTAVTAEVGNLASAQTPIATIVDLDTVEIDCSINESQVNKIVVGDKVEIRIPATGGKIFEGKIKSVSPTMDPRTKAYPLTITLANKDMVIKDGMYAEVEIITDVRKDAVVAPAQAIIQRNGVTKVFVVLEDKAYEKEVEIGLSNGKETEIIRGLEPGEEVIIRGNEDVVRGDPVKVVGRGEK
ncbi:MAG: efflux RND transporter periplasmic adaptor subunit, partial [Peptococcales bacterium]